MSLLWEQMQTPCTLMERVRVSDGEGGFTTAWTDTAAFDASIYLDNSTAARVAEKQGVKNLYTVQTAAKLRFGDVFRRVADGQVFRVTSNSDDGRTPSMVVFDFGVCSAEEWELPDGD